MDTTLALNTSPDWDSFRTALQNCQIQTENHEAKLQNLVRAIQQGEGPTATILAFHEVCNARCLHHAAYSILDNMIDYIELYS